jgi:predicted dehydrogenase
MTSPFGNDPRRWRVAVIGAGGIATAHLDALTRVDNVDIVSICDSSLMAAQFAAERYGVGRTDTSAAQMFDDLHLDVVHILTPPESHVALCEMALDAGAHVICEKPLALNGPSARALMDRAAAAHLKLTEDHNYRFNDEVQAVVDAVNSGVLGDVHDVEVSMALGISSGGPFADPTLIHPAHRLPAGAVHDLVPHLVYLGRLFVPAPPDEIWADWRNSSGLAHVRYDSLDAIMVSGQQRVRLRFDPHTKPERFTVIVRGSRGSMEVELFQSTIKRTIPRVVGEQLSPLANQIIGGVRSTQGAAVNFWNKVTKLRSPIHGLHRFVHLTYGALSDGTALPVAADDVIVTADLVDALLAAGGRS